LCENVPVTKRVSLKWVVAACLAAVCLVGVRVLLRSLPKEDRRVAAPVSVSPPRITYPADGAVFPPDIAAPTVRWEGVSARGWTVQATFRDGAAPVVAWTSEPVWRIGDAQWDEIKRHSVSNPATLSVTRTDPGAPLAASVEIRTSEAPVGTPLFFREVILPFAEAVKDPSRILWRFGDVGAKSPPAAVLGNLPVCGNCHSFSRDGSVLGMDVDYANDKGSYGIAPVAAEIALTKERIITWSDYRRGDGELTFGLLSQVSPDGRYVVSTVKDRSIFMCKDDIAFSQLFFPIKGILVVYDRQTRSFKPLPGADDRKFVQSNPSWSPDGKWILFARAERGSALWRANRVAWGRRCANCAKLTAPQRADPGPPTRFQSERRTIRWNLQARLSRRLREEEQAPHQPHLRFSSNVGQSDKTLDVDT
jgi:hypothetical protein